MKTGKIVKLSLALSLSVVSTLSSCKNNNDVLAVNPFDTEVSAGKAVREKIVVISDLHLGADLAYSECVHHLPNLTNFLKEIRESKTVKELVIAGDMIDEWYVPSRNDTYQGKTQMDFVKKIAEKNKCVIDMLNAIAEDGQISVIYTPGNHDLTITPECISAILPKVKQARDKDRLGLGTYSNTDYKLAVEHSHRYDFFCAPDYDSPQNKATGSILPAGYFFTRIAVNSVTNYPLAGEATPVPEIKNIPPTGAPEEQANSYIYYKIWSEVLTSLIPIRDKFDEKIITTKVNGLTETYSVNDILPYDNSDGTIGMNLFKGSFTQSVWENRMKMNKVPVMSNVKQAIVGSLKTEFLDEESNVQYFQNKEKNESYDALNAVRIVVFGHTHFPKITKYINADGKECIYANSGTWIDRKVKRGDTELVDQNIENMDFVIVSPKSSDKKALTVELFKYKNNKHELVKSESINL